MLKRLLEVFGMRTPEATELAARELAEARVSLLTCLTNEEHYRNSAQFQRERIARLRAYLSENHE